MVYHARLSFHHGLSLVNNSSSSASSPATSFTSSNFPAVVRLEIASRVILLACRGWSSRLKLLSNSRFSDRHFRADPLAFYSLAFESWLHLARRRQVELEEKQEQGRQAQAEQESNLSTLRLPGKATDSFAKL